MLVLSQAMFRADRFQVTVDLDVLVRADLIDFLLQESQNRGATIVCKSVTHFLFHG